jgi:tetratricopeptide (TPR) repeat protein
VRTLEPANDRVDFYEGRLRLEVGDAVAADASLSRYLGRHPEHAAAWSLRGRARLARGDPVSAAGDFSDAIARTPHPTPALYLEQSLALFSAGEEHWVSAQGAADTGLAQHPQDVALLGLATDLSLVMGQPVAAAGYLDRLPAVLGKLPQWSSRTDSLRCLDAGAVTLAQCAASARERLEQQARGQSQALTMYSD